MARWNRLGVSLRSLIQPGACHFLLARSTQLTRQSFFIRLGDRRRRLSRPHRLGVLDIEHSQRLSQTTFTGLRNFPRGFLTDSIGRNSHWRGGCAAGRLSFGPPWRKMADRRRWLDFRSGLFTARSGAGFLAVALVRWLLISPGDTLMGSLVVNVSISQWFVRMRGRALALAGMGHGLAKVCMPVLAASLIRLRRLARSMDGVRRRHTCLSSRSFPTVHAPTSGRYGSAAGRQRRGA